MSEPIVFVVDDDPGVRNSTRRLLNSVDLNVRTFGSAREFLESYEPRTAGCLVTDIRMPQMSGLELQEELSRRGYGIPVIVITGYADVPMAVRSLKAGALDFIEKPFPPQVLLDRIQNALVHDEQERKRATERYEIEERMARLTPRENEVLDLVVDGNTSRAIAERLGLSPKTVDVHRAEIMEKIGAHSIAELTRKVVTARVRAE